MISYKVGVDVGGTKIAYGLFDENNQLVLRHKSKTNADAFPDELVDTITADIDGLLEKAGAPRKALKGIGLGFPSYVEFDKGEVLFTTNMPNIHNFAAVEAFTKRFPDTQVLVDNDTNLAVIAEHKYGAARGFKHVVYTSLSTGVGSGYIINNEIFRGSYGGAGESGHMLITPDKGVMCGCKNRGCFMSYTSGSMIIKHIINEIERGTKTIMTDMVNGDLSRLNARHLNDAYGKGDALAIKMLDQMGFYLGVYIYNTFIQLNINCYLFGGGMLAFGDALMDRIKATVNRYNHEKEQKIYYKLAELGNDFGIIGAAEILD